MKYVVQVHECFPIFAFLSFRCMLQPFATEILAFPRIRRTSMRQTRIKKLLSKLNSFLTLTLSGPGASTL